MTVVTKVIKELLENGVHFGHQTNKWNPKMKKYIFGAKSGIYIIDLKQTEKALTEAVEFLRDIAASGKTILFVGTKKQAKKIIREEAQKCGMFFIDERWLGGCLTNFTTIKKSVEKLNSLQEMKQGETYDALAKKEKAQIDRVELKLLRNLEGIRDMETLPDCLIVIDAEAEHIAIKEARKINIPVIALVDTNCNPEEIEYPIPGNDDAIRSIRYIVSTLANAVKEETGELDAFTGEGNPEAPAEKKTVEAEPEEEAVNEEETVPEEETIVEEIPEKETIIEEIPEEETEGDIRI